MTTANSTLKTKHDEATFNFYASDLWNKFPEHLRSAETVSLFKSGLKTLLFNAAFQKIRYITYIHTFLICNYLFACTCLLFLSFWVFLSFECHVFMCVMYFNSFVKHYQFCVRVEVSDAV